MINMVFYGWFLLYTEITDYKITSGAAVPLLIINIITEESGIDNICGKDLEKDNISFVAQKIKSARKENKNKTTLKQH